MIPLFDLHADTLGEMYKLIGQLDYLLPRKRRALIAKKRKTK